MMDGVVYRYYTADGKSYVGCTINEKERKYAWNCVNNKYGGWKIDQARRTLGLPAFTYEVLLNVQGKDKADLMKKLEVEETKFIVQFDSFNNGYNTNRGGRGNKGIHLSAEHRAKISNSKSIGVVLVDSAGKETIVKSLGAAAHVVDAAIGTIYNHLHKYATKPIKGYQLKFAA